MTTFSDVRQLLFQAVKGTVLDPEPRDQVERTIVTRMAMHGHGWLIGDNNQWVPDGMVLDGEYSRAGAHGNLKFDDNGDRLYLDLILHHRGRRTGNLFVVEVKRLRRGNVITRRPHSEDWARLGMLVTDRPAVGRDRGYMVAAAVTIDAPGQRAWVWWRVHASIAVNAHPFFHAEHWAAPWDLTPAAAPALDRTLVWPGY